MADFVIFGATPAGMQIADSLTGSDRVLCFADYDVTRVGTTVGGLMVVPAASLLQLVFDRVIVACTDPAAAIAFLLRLGLAIEKIDASACGTTVPDDGRPTAIIFGSRLEALRTLAHVEKDFRVLCFCDPDPAMQGKRIADRFVIAPADLCVLRVDKVFIGVANTYEALHNMLWYWGVPIEKMDVVPESVLFPPAAPRATGRARTIIFGAGSSGERVFAAVAGSDDVVGFVDNSSSKHGMEFCRRPIYSPVALASLDYDRVIIGSMYASEILSQLGTLGVDPRKIVLPDQLAATAEPVARPPFWRRVLATAGL